MTRWTKVALLATSCGLVASLGGCASCSRWTKSVESDLGGGLDRTVTLYSNDGTKIQSWSGKIDISESEKEIFFDLDGKRVVIHGGTVVVEES